MKANELSLSARVTIAVAREHRRTVERLFAAIRANSDLSVPEAGRLAKEAIPGYDQESLIATLADKLGIEDILQ